MNLPSQEYLLRTFSYDPETGDLHRRATGRIAKARGKTGHLQAWCAGKVYYAHRIIWKMITGGEPATVDHADCDPANNRWANLRAASLAQNNANRGANKNNTSGFKGVRQHKCGRWVARITVDWKEHHLGLFDTPEEAHAAYVIAAQRLCGEYARAA